MLPGFKVLLLGPTGTGKTTSLRTLAAIPELEVFAIFTEPRFDVLGGEVLDRIHWRYVSPGGSNWSALTQAARLVNVMDAQGLQKLQTMGGGEYTQFLTFLGLCNRFVDQSGNDFGDVSTWGTNRVLWVDSLSGINAMVRRLKVGIKPALTQPEWGICMNVIKDTIDTLTTNLFAHLIVTAHVEREVDEVTGITRLMVSTMGRKLAPLIPLNFGDVVMAKKTTEGFFWSTVEPDADLKPCYLPLGPKLPADFGPLFREWQERGGKVLPQAPEAWR